MAVKVGGELGLDAAALKRVELGALFHDIGKIGIPAAILAKPGPLTDEERELIETHPELGEQILAPIDQLEHVRPIVRACHERYDGKGYPDGLAGDEIPLEARIIFVCDAFHAMTTTRPYRDALPDRGGAPAAARGGRLPVRPGDRRGLPARARGPVTLAPGVSRLAASASRHAPQEQERAPLDLDLAPHDASPTRPPRAPGRPSTARAPSDARSATGGSLKDSASRHALKSTRNESSTIGSPSRVSAMISAPLRNAPTADASPRSQSRRVMARPSGRNHQTSGAPESSCSLPVRNVGRRKIGCARRSAISRRVKAMQRTRRARRAPSRSS